MFSELSKYIQSLALIALALFSYVKYLNTIKSYLPILQNLAPIGEAYKNGRQRVTNSHPLSTIFVSLSIACDCIYCDQKLLCHLEMRD